MSAKILFVYHYVALYREPVFCELVASDDMEVWVASDVVSNNDIRLVSKESPIYHSNRFLPLFNAWFKNRVLWQDGLIRALFSKKWDAVVFLGDPNFLTTWIGLLLLRFTKCKPYLWTHGFVMRGGVLQRRLKMLMYGLSDGVFLYGNNSRKELEALGVSPSKLHVIYNSLDYSAQKSFRAYWDARDVIECRSKFFSEPVDFLLIFVGRLTFHKKLVMCLDAMAKLAMDDVKVNLLFVGDGEAREELEGVVGRLGLSGRVCFYGSCHEERELARLFHCSDVCVAPGEIGLTTMHALAYGVPCITHSNDMKQMPEFEAVISGRTGELFEDGNVEDLARAILTVKHRTKNFYFKDCIDVIEKFYTPEQQALRFREVLNG